MNDIVEIRRLLNLLESTQQVAAGFASPTGNQNYPGVTYPNLIRLKELAYENFLYLANEYNRQKDERRRLLICAALQHRPRSGFEHFFVNLLDHSNEEFVSCACMALGKARYSGVKHKLRQLLTTGPSIRLEFHIGFALILLQDTAGVDIFRSILTTESEYVTVKRGGIQSPDRREIYAARIDLILGALFGENPQGAGDPFRWIERWRNRSLTGMKWDPSDIPTSLVEYVDTLDLFT